MVHDRIHYAGRYRFDRRADLDRALMVAREQLALEDDPTAHGSGWLRGFVPDGATVTIALAVPATSELRFAAAELFETMARAAIDGLVEGTIGGRYVDYYPSGADADD